MFNYDNRVTLADFKEHGEVVRDVEFFGVGKIGSRIEHRVVPVVSKRTLSEALEQGEGVSAIICPPDLAAEVPDSFGCLAARDPLVAAHQIHSELVGRKDYYWTDFRSRISGSARIHPAAAVAERNVVIEDDVEIDAGAIIRERVVLGKRTYVGAKTLIGSRAFELVRIDGRNVAQAQAGGVRVGADAIILSMTSVVSSIYATFTEIGENVAIDNLVHVGHDVIIERGARVAACALVGGRVVVEPDSFIGPAATVSNGLTVGAGAIVSVGSTATKDIPSGTRATGYFAIEHEQFLRNLKASLE